MDMWSALHFFFVPRGVLAFMCQFACCVEHSALFLFGTRASQSLSVCDLSSVSPRWIHFGVDALRVQLWGPV